MLVEDFRAQLAARFPGWGAACIRQWADYLGFTLGPDSGARYCQNALEKFQQRADLWALLGFGLHFTSMAYNVYVASL